MWTLNNTPLRELGLTIGGWTQTPMSIDVLALQVSAEKYDADVPNELELEQKVNLKRDGITMFQGRITKTPRNCSGVHEGWSYEVSGGWWDLDNLAFQQERNYYDGLNENGDPIKKTQLIGYVILGRNSETTGHRISAVIDFAISQGAYLQKGQIDDGIVWMPSEHKDQTCGSVIRDYMRITSNQVAWIDHSTTPPTFNVTAQSNLTEKSFDINSGDEILSHSIDRLQTEVPKGIVIRYEIPITEDGNTYVKVIEDSAGETSGFGVLPVSIPLAGHNITTEKAATQVRDIPEAGAIGPDVRDWWIHHIDALRTIIEKDPAILPKIEVPFLGFPDLGIRTHDLKLPELPEPPKPLNPDAVPVVPSDELGDYPRELIGGALPDWTGKKYRQMDCSVSLLMKKDDIDVIGNAETKKALKEIFKDPKFIGADLYYIGNFDTSITATNATNREYSHIASHQSGDDPPLGIAAAVFAQFQRVRHAGELVIKEFEITKKVQPGDSISFDGGRPEWANMKEMVQSVSYDVNTGETSIQFGPPNYLGVQDMIDRLNAYKRLPSNYGFDPDQDHPESVGGISATPRDTTSKLEPQAPAQSHYFGPLEIFRKDGGGAEVIPVPTHFLEMTHSEVKMHPVKINGKLTTAEPKPILSMSGNSKYNCYAEFETDPLGVINGEIKAHFSISAAPASTQHVPPSSSDSGTNGHYYKLIGVYDVPFSPADPIIYQPVSSPSWECIDREFKNVGAGAGVHKSTAKDKQEFRSMKGTDGAASGPGETVQGKITFEENGDTVEAKIFYKKEQLGGGPDEGEVQTGEFKFYKNEELPAKLKKLKFNNGLNIGDVPEKVIYQTPLLGDDFHSIDNNLNPGQVQLLNNNQDPADPLNPDKNNKPQRGSTGWYATYVAVGGEVGGASVFMTTPKALAKDANGNLTQTPREVTLQSLNTQADGNALPVKNSS